MKFQIALLLALLSSTVFAQDPQLSPNAPEDKPQSVHAGEMEAFEIAIAPYIAQAKASYPLAKGKFLAGLPEGQSFFVTTRLYDDTGTFEQVFIAVHNIDNGSISGKVWSEIGRVSGYLVTITRSQSPAFWIGLSLTRTDLKKAIMSVSFLTPTTAVVTNHSNSGLAHETDCLVPGGPLLGRLQQGATV